MDSYIKKTPNPWKASTCQRVKRSVNEKLYRDSIHLTLAPLAGRNIKPIFRLRFFLFWQFVNEKNPRNSPAHPANLLLAEAIISSNPTLASQDPIRPMRAYPLKGNPSMALKPIIYKLKISLNNTDRNYYDSLNLTVANTHPKPMARILAFCRMPRSI